MTIVQLDRSLGDAENGALPRSDVAPFFDDLQANILKAHGRDHCIFACLTFAGGEPSGIGEWVRALCDGTSLGIALTSAREQNEQAIRRKQALAAGIAPQQEAVLSLWLTYSGCAKLGITPPAHAPHAEGMSARGAAFGDPAGVAWEQLDAVVLIATDDAADLTSRTGRLQQSANAAVTVGAIERCAVRRNAATLRVEPFGFVDGVSDPDFWGTYEPRTAANPWAPLDLVLVPEGPAGRYGTFVVVRKLMQDVDGFEQALIPLTEQRTGHAATPAEVELTRAFIMGRFRDGTPVITHSMPAGAADPENDFTAATDPFGASCPVFAHVRKMNPRGGSRFEPLAQERNHRIARRGMPLIDDAGQPRGLMFVCLQSDIARQFEFMQRVWGGSPDFPFSGTGREILIGRRASGGLPDVDRRWPAKWHSPGKRIPFGDFVRLAGGAYLFAPSIAALRETWNAP